MMAVEALVLTLKLRSVVSLARAARHQSRVCRRQKDAVTAGYFRVKSDAYMRAAKIFKVDWT